MAQSAQRPGPLPGELNPHRDLSGPAGPPRPPAHGGFGPRIQALLAHHRRRAAETLAIVRREGGLNAYQVASRMTWDIRADSWADFPLNQKWFATGEALAHLEYLAEEGAVVRALDQEGMARYTAQ
ncbi:MAG: hypothetical protein ACLSCQ_15080 [Evtepia gabavorous]